MLVLFLVNSGFICLANDFNIAYTLSPGLSIYIAITMTNTHLRVGFFLNGFHKKLY